MANHVIYYRDCIEWHPESESARNHFKTYSSRIHVPDGSIVIPRYSALPFYKELESDLNCSGSRLINSYEQHQYVADIKNWYYDLKDVTPETWDDVSIIPEEGPFVLKGETNSMKQLWSTHMFAKDKREAITVAGNLYNDNLIGSQHIYVRRYVPLKTYMISLRNLPITKEFRFFFYKKNVVASGYYWANHAEDLQQIPSPKEVPQKLIEYVSDRVSQHINFYVVDFAQCENGDWIVIELNDGSMSGLSCCNPNELYSNLAKVLS